MTDVLIVIAWLALLVLFVALRARATRGSANASSDASMLAGIEREALPRVDPTSSEPVTARRRRVA